MHLSGKSNENNLFNQLNYSIGNEDNMFEACILPEHLSHAMCTAGSGVSPMAVLSGGPSILSCVDISVQQLYFTELRIESARKLAYEEFLSFWSYPGHDCDSNIRRSMFNSLSLTTQAKAFLLALFEKYEWDTILYSGRFERLPFLGGKIFRLLLGKKLEGIFLSNNIDEQKSFFTNSFPKKRVDLSILLHALIYRLYVSLIKGMVRPNIDESFNQFFRRIFYNLFQEHYIRENLFLQLYLYKKLLYLEACPPECNRTIFNRIKASVDACDIRYIHDDIVCAAMQSEVKIDFINFSNIPSYFEGNTEGNYLQMIRPKLNAKALVLNRYHLRMPEKLDTTGYSKVTSRYMDFIKKESTQLYDIMLFERD